MKSILVVGEWKYSIYEKTLAKGFKSLGWEVYKFSWGEYFNNYLDNDISITRDVFNVVYYKLQNKFKFGPVIKQINDNLIRRVIDLNVDVVFVNRGTHIYPNTINQIKECGVKVVYYNNDDPFSSAYKHYFWRHYLKSVKLCDLVYAYRDKNLMDYKGIGVDAKLLMSYYDKDINFCMKGVRKEYDVIFIGHFEDDGRDECLLYLHEKGVKVGLFGSGWNKSKRYDDLYKVWGEIRPIFKEYNEYLNKAFIGLVFLSKVNNDKYTRRCFEIPAAGTVMLSERNSYLEMMFEDNVEALFFSTKEECLKKVRFILNDANAYSEMVSNSLLRLTNDGHEIADRARQITKDLEND